jgi:sulfotransferase 6B1
VPRWAIRNSFARRHLVDSYAAYVRFRASGRPPRVLINSIPKAGTHLVASVLSRLPDMRYAGRYFTHEQFSLAGDSGPECIQSLDRRSLSEALAKISPGTFANGHFYWDSATQDALQRHAFRLIFMVRDPRDILVSQLRYIEEFKAHPRHRSLTREFPTSSDRLMALIKGYRTGLGDDLAPANERFGAYMGWRQTTGVLNLRFEDFSRDLTARTPGVIALEGRLMELAEFVGRPLNASALAEVGEGIGDRKSSTFRSGRTGGWPEVFEERHVEALRQQDPDILQAFGYEW